MLRVLFGAVLNAREIEIWTDVDGLRTADARLVQIDAHCSTHLLWRAARKWPNSARVMYATMIAIVDGVGHGSKINFRVAPHAVGSAA